MKTFGKTVTLGELRLSPLSASWSMPAHVVVACSDGERKVSSWSQNPNEKLTLEELEKALNRLQEDIN